MKKKLLSILLLSTMTLAAVTACGNSEAPESTQLEESSEPAPAADKAEDAGDEKTQEEAAPTSDSAEKEVTITLGIWPEDTLTDDIAVHEGYVETMKELHPGVTVVPAYYKYSTDTFMPMVESGNCPTIFESWFTEPQKLINAGAIADITDELAARGWLDAMNPSIRELLSDENGRVYGIPRDGYALGLMLNMELFEEAGLVDDEGYPIVPKTWDELAETAKKIKDATGSAGLCLLAKDAAGGWHFSNIAWAFGATLCTENADGTFTADLNSPEAVKAMEFVKSLKWDYDVLTADPLSEDWGTGFTQLGTGGAAMYIGANDAVAQPTQVNGLPVDKLAMCAIPAADGGQFSLYGGTPYMFSKDATPEEINAALDYLEIMGKAPVATEASIAGMKADAENKVANGVPVIQRFPCWVNQDVLDAEAAIVEEYGNVDPKLYETYFAAASSEGLHLEEPGSTQDMYAELTKVLQTVLTDKDSDVQALMDQADANYQKILDDTFGAAN
ncbi:ABC transporter substrate-binding protein [Butyrivibrio sp. MC2013]|uniref:ABC transporter substrate-binding protein n=1 Tax=Butyrivibrio sp. MC2013 TaxID=1280686 RepID=UPI000428E30F|nr:extracellular solute-binding protein [Butyrivibrio sp. MC2013]